MNNFKEKFEKMRIAGNLASRTLDMLTENIKPGISTDEIDKLGYEFIKDNGGFSAPLFYRGFKKSLCTSLNHVVCHGIPSDRVLNEGDIINIDVTAIVEDYHGDTSRMFCIGKTPVKANNLISATYEAMMRAIKILKPNVKLGDIKYSQIVKNILGTLFFNKIFFHSELLFLNAVLFTISIISLSVSIIPVPFIIDLSIKF